MNREERERIAEFFEPLTQEFADEIKSIILTGSAVRKERVEGSDIDILVIVDDHSEEYGKEDLKDIQEVLKKIENTAEEEDYDLHIQPPKPVSNWYSLLLNGRPWAITSMIHSQAVYDPDGFQESVQEMIENTGPASNSERADRLEEEVKDHLEDAEGKLEEGFNQIMENVDRSARALAKYREDSEVSGEEISENFETHFEDIDTDIYRELQEYLENMEKSEEEPGFQDLENFSEKAVKLIKQLQESFESEIGEFQQELLEQTMKELEETCKVLLEEKDVEYSEEEVFEKFREEVIEEGVLSRDYWKLIEETRELRKENPGEIDEESIYHPIVGLREFESAVNSVIERDIFESFELHSDTETAHITPINEYEEKMLDGFEEEIRGVYVVSTEHLLETDTATVVIVTEGREKEIEEKAGNEEVEIGEEHGFNIHTQVEELADYWERLQEGEEDLIYEVKSSIVSYDPNRLLESTQKLVEQGKIPGTIPSVKKSMARETLKSVMPVKKVKQECLKEYYKASIKTGQARLLRKGFTPPVQKKVPEKMREELLEDGETTEDEVENIEKTINLFKNREYGTEDDITGEELDEIREKLSRTV